MNTFLKVVGIGALCLVGGCLVVGAIGGAAIGKAAKDPKVKQAIEAMNAPPVVTLAEFNAIQTGMTRDQVTAIVGDPGQVQSENTMANIHTMMVSWQNGDFSGANVMLQNGRVMSKSQLSLK